MVIATHTLAFILRIASLTLSLFGLCPLLFRVEVGLREHVFVLCSAACLMLSGAIVASDVSQFMVSAVVLLCAIACDVLYYLSSPRVSHILLPVAYLCCLGVAIEFDTYPSMAIRHAEFVVVGMIACMILCWASRSLDNLLAASFPALLILTVALCALPLLPKLGVEVNAAKSWLAVGQQTVQPSELAKVTLALSLSAYLAANAWRLSHFSIRGLYPIVAVFGLAMFLLMAQNDLGTGLVLFSLFASMLVMCSKKAGFVYAFVLAACVLVLVGVAAKISSHVMARFVAWKDPYSDPQGIGYQRIAAMQAMANGGLVGTGLHFGRMLYYVPEVHSDYVYVAIVEELGLIGGTIVALAVSSLVAIAARAASCLPDGSFERNVLVAGSSLLLCQSFVIVGGVTGVMPLTGVTLPFVSHGGSSLLSCLGLVGLMGGCASALDSTQVGDPRVPFVLSLVASVSMAFCVAAVVRTQGQLRLVGETRRDLRAGDVATADGVVLASSPSADARAYPQGTLAAHVLGEASSGIDGRVRSTCVEGINPLLNLLALPDISKETVLTIDSRIQEVAESQLQGTKGAIVVMDASSGELLAVASSPTYDVSYGYDPNAGDGVSYLNRAAQALYFPGSTFKVVTMAAALEGGYAGPDSLYTGDTVELASGGKVVNYQEACYGDITLVDALTLSSNTAFATLALEMGEAPIADMAEALGFNTGLGITDFSVATSTYMYSSSDYARAWASVGQSVWVDGEQYGPSATVVQMASVMATIANGGVRCTPHLVASGPLLGAASETVAMRESTASELWKMMVASSGSSLEGFEVAGKTGTAQSGDGTLCWYICAAEGISVACCIEADASGMGSEVARPRAISVLEEAMGISYAKNEQG